MKGAEIEKHLAVPSMKRLGSLRKRPFFHSKLDSLIILRLVKVVTYGDDQMVTFSHFWTTFLE